MKQHTLSTYYCFEGKGLHTGRYAHMTLKPAPPHTGIVFVRTDLGPQARLEALAEYVTDTSRSTTLSCGDTEVHTVEHLLSALTGLGVDNALVEIDNLEVPILDGSARPYVEAMLPDPLVEQDAPRRYIALSEPIEVRDESRGSWVRIEPSEAPAYEAEVDFNSRVLGIQQIHWDPSVDYATQIGPCRTFVFLHEIAYLAQMGLVQGGDIDNAIVVVEHPIPQEQFDRLCDLFQVQDLKVCENGYLNNLQLYFDDECGRHKMLDLIGDMRLCGGFLKARVSACKPGHAINTLAAKAVREALINP